MKAFSQGTKKYTYKETRYHFCSLEFFNDFIYCTSLISLSLMNLLLFFFFNFKAYKDVNFTPVSRTKKTWCHLGVTFVSFYEHG